MKTLALLSAALLLVITETLAQTSQQTPISIRVINSVTNKPEKIYQTTVSYRGILIGALRRLQASNQDFTFTYTEDPNYGPYLERVNGLSGCLKKRTYWQLQVKKPNGSIVTPDVGIGCYIPTAHDEILLTYTKY